MQKRNCVRGANILLLLLMGAGVFISATVESGVRTGSIVVAGQVIQITQDPSDILVPVVLAVPGLNDSYFTSELTLANRGNQEASLQLNYTGSSQFSGGSGSATVTLEAGRQQVIPDAIAYLRSLGIPIPVSGSQVGTVRIHASGVPASEVGVTVRTTTPVFNGRAGLAYSGIPTSKLLSENAYISGLRQDGLDRSNVAVLNAGNPGDGEIVMRITVYSGDPNNPVTAVLPDLVLQPGDFRQISGILHSNGLTLSQGYVQVTRVTGVAPYYAYGVINDQVNSDGSFIPPQKELDLPLNIPAVVETSAYHSEVVITNWSQETKTTDLVYYADAIQNQDKFVKATIEIKGGEQVIIPDFVQYLRQQGVAGMEKTGITYTGTLEVNPQIFSGKLWVLSPYGVYAGARTWTPGGGGHYGVFYSGISIDTLDPLHSVWLYGLQQNEETRSNLTVINRTGYPSGICEVEIFDGETGSKAGSIEHIVLPLRGWLQFTRILADYAPGVRQGYARVTAISVDSPVLPLSPFLAYAVVNDGSVPGERTGDGAFIQSSP